MKWSTLKQMIDEAIHEKGLSDDEVEVWYVDLSKSVYTR